MTQSPRNIEVFNEDGSFAIRAPSYIDNIVLAANTEYVYAIPANANYLFFSSDGNFYAGYVGNAGQAIYQTAMVAAVPAANSVTGIGLEQNPTARYVGGLINATTKELKEVHLVAAQATKLSIAVYK
jgi:hypothetical protein